MTENSFPYVPEDLVEALDSLFPDRCPSPEWDDRRIWIEVGQRKVVNLLKHKISKQNENVLNGS